MDTREAQIEDMRKRFEELLPVLRRFLQHDIDCSVWREYTVCDCGLDAVLRRVPKDLVEG